MFHLFTLTLIKPLVCSGISVRVLESTGDLHVVGIKIFKNSEVGNYNKQTILNYKIKMVEVPKVLEEFFKEEQINSGLEYENYRKWNFI